MKVMSSWDIYLATFFLGRLSPLSGKKVRVHILSPNKLTPALLESEEGRVYDRRKYFMINLHEKNVPGPGGDRSRDHRSDTHLTGLPRPASKVLR